jgi:hypothetical protein
MRALILVAAAALALAACGDDTDNVSNTTLPPIQTEEQGSWVASAECEGLPSGNLQIVGVEGEEVTVRQISSGETVTTHRECLMRATGDTPTIPRVGDDPLEPRMPSS